MIDVAGAGDVQAIRRSIAALNIGYQDRTAARDGALKEKMPALIGPKVAKSRNPAPRLQSIGQVS